VIRKVLLVVSILVLAVLVFTSPVLEERGNQDFVEYWSAGRLNLLGGNPYDPEQLIPVQRQTGRTKGVPIMMWNPPWTLTLVMPLSGLPYSLAQTLWMLSHITIIFGSLTWFWTFYGGDPKYRWVSWLVGFSFGPLLHVLKMGQIGPLLLLSITGFFYFYERDKEWLTGASLALLTIKPHLLYLLLLALFLWSVDRQKWNVILGGTGGVLLLLGIAWGINPALLRQYDYAVTHYPPEQWATPTLGALLRLSAGVEHFWLQFVPPILGATWLYFYWRRHRECWCWSEQLPLLILISVVTTAYGWTFDYVVAVLALLPIAILMIRGHWRSHLWAKVGLLVIYVAWNGIALFTSREQGWYWWLAPSLLIWYVFARKRFADALQLS
jgi:hypothetical protein